METTPRPTLGLLVVLAGLLLAIAWGCWPWVSAIFP